MIKILLITGGGAVGSLLRYTIQQAMNASFPASTLAVNFLGCFAIGVLWAVFYKAPNESLQLLLMTGFCGGFTTFSAFSMESVQMFTTGRWAAFVLYAVSSVGGGLLATYLGFKIFAS